MKKIFLLASALLSFACIVAQAQSFDYGSYAPHPRLLMEKDGQKSVKAALAENPDISIVHDRILSACDSLLSVPVLTYEKEGHRLLSVSRKALMRMFYLGYAWRMTGDDRYFKRTERELTAVCNFPDWNPVHFLDVGEMTMAVAIGYDWLYDRLSDDSRAVIRKAIAEKGFAASRNEKHNWFLRTTNNWNQVCNAGLVFGALAVLEDYPDQAREMIERAMKAVRLPLKGYAPDGAYPEGYNYWGYGTTFQVLMCAALESAFGHDGGLSAREGFLASARYMLYMAGPAGKCFNFSDSPEFTHLLPAMFWFADKTGDATLLWNERKSLGMVTSEDVRFLPLVPIFGARFKMQELPRPEGMVWAGGGTTPVVLVRTGWQSEDDLYLAVKGGRATTSHAHMDGGSFVFDAMGVRWAKDLGMNDYWPLERAGVDLWNSSQKGGRWKMFRYNNFAHNTLTVNGALHNVKGFVPVVRVVDERNRAGAVLDMTSLFDGALVRAEREAVIADRSYLLVTDRLEAADKPADVRWTLVTGADARVVDGRTVELTEDGKRLRMFIDSRADVGISILDNVPQNDFEESNDGTCRVAVDLRLRPGQKEELRVRMVPVTSSI